MSLVRLDETESEPRFRMLETIREYAVDRLIEANEDAAVRERHAAFYLAFAEAVEPELVRANQVEWLDRLDADGPNITAALSWILDQNRIEEIASVGGDAVLLAQARSLGEGSRWLTAFLERPSQWSVTAHPGACHWRGRLLQPFLGAPRGSPDALPGCARLVQRGRGPDWRGTPPAQSG